MGQRTPQPASCDNTGVKRSKLPEICRNSHPSRNLTAIQNYERFIEGEEDRVSIYVIMNS